MKASAESLSIVAGVLSDAHQQRVHNLCVRFHEVYLGEPDRAAHNEVLREYVALKLAIVDRGVRFGIINNRIFLGEGEVHIPLLLGNTVLAFRVDSQGSQMVGSYTVRDGTIITDGFLFDLVGFTGETADLESELFELDITRCKSVRVGHIRDMAAQLERMAQSANLADATYLLRTLVAQTSLLSFKEYLSAKNLRTEVRRLQAQLLNFLNSPVSYRLPFLIRILVRNISSVVAKPKLIDRLWNDTIDLAEVHLRGSSIVNEIRRSTHHAVGRRTLLTVQSYLEFLETGNFEGLTKLGYPEPGPADHEARAKDRPREIVARILHDLEELLGSADILGRVGEWQTRYTTVLSRCESDEGMASEAERAIEDGIREGNRWMFYHHVRIMRNRVLQFRLLPGATAASARFNRMLDLEPDGDGVDTATIEKELRECVAGFVDELQSTYQDNLFRKLAEITVAFENKAFLDSFILICELRKDLRVALIEGAFPEQRLLSYELDCLLEEISFVAMRHIAGSYEENGVDLPQCLEIIGRCALSLSHDGLHSRQLLDLVGMLRVGSHSFAEFANVLQQIRRNYQHILRQLTVPFENMKEWLEVDEKDLHVALANMQRFLHDLNSMAAFADTALKHIEHLMASSDDQSDLAGSGEQDSDDDDGVIHLSDQARIRTMVEEADPRHNLRALYGGKGSGLTYIRYLNIPTPDGFILPTTLARRRARGGETDWLDASIRKHLAALEADIEKSQGQVKQFGNPERPLLLAVRGGSVFSMPGILATILFTGMNDEIAEALVKLDPWHAYDSYRRFLASYGRAVWGVDVEKNDLVEQAKSRYSVKYKDALPWEAMREVVEATKDVFRDEGFGDELEQSLNDPFVQLSQSVQAVMDSWNHPTCKWYRELKGICDGWSTAVVIQEMSSGNRQNEKIRIGMDETKASLTGVVPKTAVTEFGVSECTGEFKFSACGEDLVGGLTTSSSFQPFDELKTHMPMLYRRLHHKVARLRSFMGTDQEIEFTVDHGVLSVLQSRAAEIGANQSSRAFQEPGEEITRGLGIRGSAFRGLVAFDEKDYHELKKVDMASRDDVDGILMVLENPTPADIPLVMLAEGLLASKGGSTSHAAVAINSIEQKDYSAVMSSGRLNVSADRHEAVIVDKDGSPIATIHAGDVVSIHGATGMVYIGSREIGHNNK